MGDSFALHERSGRLGGIIGARQARQREPRLQVARLLSVQGELYDKDELVLQEMRPRPGSRRGALTFRWSSRPSGRSTSPTR
jgi:hypothetical protein